MGTFNENDNTQGKDKFTFDKDAYLSYQSAEQTQFGFSNGRTTPSNIDQLNPGEVFVFGSNANGHHAGGAARVALDKFGAIWGQGDGLQGQSYAISTMEGLLNTAANINRFIRFAAEHQEYKFFITPIGCGIAGFNPLQIAPLFSKAIILPNVYLPRIFWEYFWMTENCAPDSFTPDPKWTKWEKIY